MRKNFDFVDMRDYDADLTDLAKQSANIIAGLKADLEAAKKFRDYWFFAAVIAAGGRLVIKDQDWIAVEGAKLKRWRDERNDADVYEIDRT